MKAQKPERTGEVGKILPERQQLFFCSYGSCPLQECPHMVALLLKVRPEALPMHIYQARKGIK